MILLEYRILILQISERKHHWYIHHRTEKVLKIPLQGLGQGEVRGGVFGPCVAGEQGGAYGRFAEIPTLHCQCRDTEISNEIVALVKAKL